MRLCIPLLLLIGGFAVADEPERGAKEKEFSAETKKELKKFEGKWRVVKGAGSGQESDLTDKMAYFVFKGTELTMTSGGKVENYQVSDIDTTADPKCIDLVEKRKGRPDRTWEGAYRFVEDTLQLAHELPGGTGKNRPTSFDKSVERAIVWTLKRAKD
jgi:uncharacterized protein (TIGR03067 family)